MNIPDNVKKQLEALNRQFRMDLPNKIQELQELWQEYCQERSMTNAFEFYRKSHSLSGSLDIYGMGELAQYCKKVEHLVKTACENDTDLDEGTRLQTHKALKQLVEKVAQFK